MATLSPVATPLLSSAAVPAGTDAARAAAARPARGARRRQRSVRVSVATVLLGIGTAGVALALPGQSPAWLSVAAVVALICGWAALRIVWTEVLQSRREHAADRAAQAQAYRSMFSERAGEHAEFTSSMTDRLRERDREVTELTASLFATEKRAVEAESRVRREARRANEAQERLEGLRDQVEQLEIRLAEKQDQLASWDGLETVADLMAWEERAGAAAAPETRQKHA